MFTQRNGRIKEVFFGMLLLLECLSAKEKYSRPMCSPLFIGKAASALIRLSMGDSFTRDEWKEHFYYRVVKNKVEASKDNKQWEEILDSRKTALLAEAKYLEAFDKKIKESKIKFEALEKLFQISLEVRDKSYNLKVRLKDESVIYTLVIPQSFEEKEDDLPYSLMVESCTQEEVQKAKEDNKMLQWFWMKSGYPSGELLETLYKDLKSAD